MSRKLVVLDVRVNGTMTDRMHGYSLDPTFALWHKVMPFHTGPKYAMTQRADRQLRLICPCRALLEFS